MSEKPRERMPTTEMLVKLMNAESFQEFYVENIDKLQVPKVSQFLAVMCEEKGIVPNKLFQEIDIEKSLGHQILSGRRRLTRDNAIKMAFGLGLDITESQRLLTISKNSQLYPFIPRDAAILYCLHNKINYRDTQSNLYEWGMTVLGDSKKHGALL